MTDERDEILEEDDELYEHHRIVVDKGQSPLRIDRFLMDRLQNATRTKIQAGIESESVRVNDNPTKASYKIRPLDVITVSLPHPPRDTDIKPENIPLDLVFEDADLLVLNKAPGMVVHPAHGNWDGTLLNALVYHFENLPTGRNGEARGPAPAGTPERDRSSRPGLVHRIDKDTSGLMVIAKTEFAMTHLARQFFDHTIERTYNALVWGVPEPADGTITGYIGRALKDRKVQAIYDDEAKGKWAVTHYKTLEPLRYVSLVQCNLETGRTHQIRAHFKHIGHPLFNDAMYGGDRIVRGMPNGTYKTFVENAFKLIPRQALHAKSLGFVHPRSREWLQFEQPLPPDFQAALAKWQRLIKKMNSPLTFPPMISIRPGTRADIPQAFDLVTELAIYEKAADQVSNTADQMAEDGFGPNPVFGMLIAEDSANQKIVGMAVYYFRYSTWKGKRLYLEDIIVTEAFRGYGIGKLLLDATIDMAHETGCTGMMWQVLDWNQPAIGFYQQFGTRFDNGWTNCHLDF